MIARSETRDETCDDCGATRERFVDVLTVPKGYRLPLGYVVESQTRADVTAVRPTRMTTLCLCDAP